MRYLFDTDKFSKAIKTKRLINLNIGLREVSTKIKVSAATLSRLENGTTPEIENLLKICGWLGESPSEFFYTQYKPSKPIKK